MQRGSDKNARGAARFGRREIAGIAQAAGEVDKAPPSAPAHFCKPTKIRPGGAADPLQRHHDDPRWPDRGIVEQIRWAKKDLAAKVERENDARIAMKRGKGRAVPL